MRPPDPFALGGRHGDDAKVRQLFWRWRAAQRAYGLTDGDEDAYEQICAIEDQILSMQGPAALAIKAYFVITRADILGRSCEGSIISETSAVSEEIIVSLLRDAAAFVPELAPLTAAIIEPHVAGGAP